MATLDERIARWRHDLAEALGGTAETLEELEGHLRDDVARRVQDGQPVEEAFDAAAAGLGSPAELAAEFARTTPATWLPVQVALIGLIAVAGCLVGLLTRRSDDPLLAVHILAVTLGYTTTLVVGTLAACYLVARLFGAPRPAQVQGLLRATRHLTLAALVLAAGGVLLGGLWAQDRLGRFWDWDAKESGGLGVVLWGVAFSVVLARRLLDDHVALTLGLVGNVVVALAWFGPNALGLGLHSYGAVTAGALGLFVLSQAALAGLAFLPPACLRRVARRVG